MLVGTPAPANRGHTPCRPSTIPKSEPETMPKDSGTSAKERPAGDTATDAGVLRFHGVRYQVKDVSRSADFYSRHLGFKVEHQHLPEFATLVLGPLDLLLSGPGASGSRPLPGGAGQIPGGSNRIVLRTSDLRSWIEKLKSAGLRFRNEMETGPAGSQIQLEDPDGNPVELFEPARKS